MLRESIYFFRKLVFAADLCLVALAFQLSVIFDSLRQRQSVNIFADDGLFIPATLIWGMVFWFMPECYTVRLRNIGDILFSSFKTGIIATGLFLAYIFTFGYLDESRFQIFLFSGMSVALIGVFRLAIVAFLEYYRSLGLNYRTVLVVGTGNTAKGFVDKIITNSRFGLKALGFIDWEKKPDLWRYRDIPRVGNLDSLPQYLKNNQVDWVVFAVGRKFLGKMQPSIEICEKMGIQMAVLADFFPLKLAKKRVDTFFDSPLIFYDTLPKASVPLLMKGFFDRVLAGIGLAMVSPLLLVVGLAVKMTSRGPALFQQERRGLNGKKFVLYKFRTMVKDAEERKKDLSRFNEVKGAAFKMQNDPRVTPLGKFLRKTSLDELPQLINILKGDMSFVGPRPPLAEEVAEYDLWQRRRLSMKPGLTCLWQISGRSDIPFEQWMKLDLKYIDNWSLWEDAKIMVKTVPAVFRGTGAR